MMSPGWSFYVPDDVVAMKQLSALMEKVMNAYSGKPSEGQSSNNNGGTRAIFHRFTGFSKEIKGSRATSSSSSHEKLYNKLIKLAEDCEKYISAMPESSTTQPQNPE